ncbi:MAG: molybdopterin molybdotransferase MoeA [Opitutae bacterium]|nr:molybdopterin molybdotransferase MoeA [Opitutae bacterium]MBT5690317.1 molybdopterin molybdotransferase MoeA [Opitutae bacterium]MBT6462506.1 molybdopterin molybdotransferase MoeA [Opitutae bacterium]MBT7852345.1 molybdopterin molybdotransferase MoeA [Opitutae bacterium]
MISVKDAFETILNHVTVLPYETCVLGKATSRTLRHPVSTDHDLPPYNRIMMDGIAARSEAFIGGDQVRLKIIGLQSAGSLRKELTNTFDCFEVATGAVLPLGADVVIPVEEISISENYATVSEAFKLTPGRYIHRKGSDRSKGEVLLPEGIRLGAKEIAVAASCGYNELKVAACPSVAIISTGDELVDIDKVPMPHQIRRSNSHSLAAALLSSGLGIPNLSHFVDDASKVRDGLLHVLQTAQIITLCGGVSKGRLDHLPRALEAVGVIKHFHWVAQRPGKPFLFGTGPSGQPVFALPGNPLSALTCFHRYVIPALEKMAGRKHKLIMKLPLQEPYSFKPQLTNFLPIEINNGVLGSEVKPHPAGNSGDFAGILNTDGFIELPAEGTDYRKGLTLPFWPWL